MMNTTNHTPTPWYAANWTSHAPRTVLVDDAATLSGKRVVAECERDEDAAFIVRACNSHEQLVAALGEANDLLALNGIGLDDDADYGNGRAGDIVGRIRAALAATGAA